MRIPKIIGTATFLAAWLTPWRPAFRVRPPGSKLSFYVHHRDLIGRHIAKYGTHEPVPTRWIGNYLRTAKPGLFIDVGANPRLARDPRRATSYGRNCRRIRA